MEYGLPLMVLSHVADCCPYCLSVLLEVFSDTQRENYAGEPLIYTKEFVENTRFRKWPRFVADVRELCFHGLFLMKHTSKDEIEVTLLFLQEVESEELE